MASESGPWAGDTVTYTYSDRLRKVLDLQQPNASDWVQNYGYDTANRMNASTSPAGTFTYAYNAGVGGITSASSLVTNIALPNLAAITNAYDGNARMTVTALINSVHRGQTIALSILRACTADETGAGCTHAAPDAH